MGDGDRSMEDDTTIISIKNILSKLPGASDGSRMREKHLDSIQAALNSRGDIFLRNDLIVLRSGSVPEMAIPVRSLPVKIGRSQAMADWVVDIKGISRIHCYLERNGALVRLRDAGSKNGTYLNREKIDREDLCVGDEIVIGTTAFTIDRQ